jgi:deazaflavin-dependent oxidoreductase (nitroreductase family)
VTLDAGLALRSVCILETIGRRSGEPRRIEIWFAADPIRDRIYMLAGGRDQAHWVLNLRRNPRVRVRIGDRWITGSATDIEGGDDELPARQIVGGKYQGWQPGRPLSSWARESLTVAIDLDLQGQG